MGYPSFGELPIRRPIIHIPGTYHVLGGPGLGLIGEKPDVPLPKPPVPKPPVIKPKPQPKPVQKKDVSIQDILSNPRLFVSEDGKVNVDLAIKYPQLLRAFKTVTVVYALGRSWSYKGETFYDEKGAITNSGYGTLLTIKRWLNEKDVHILGIQVKDDIVKDTMKLKGALRRAAGMAEVEPEPVKKQIYEPIKKEAEKLLKPVEVKKPEPKPIITPKPPAPKPILKHEPKPDVPLPKPTPKPEPPKPVVKPPAPTPKPTPRPVEKKIEHNTGIKTVPAPKPPEKKPSVIPKPQPVVKPAPKPVTEPAVKPPTGEAIRITTTAVQPQRKDELLKYLVIALIIIALAKR